MIESVIIYTNGMVMVFDDTGNQVTSLQGRFADKAEAISKKLTDKTSITYAQWRGSILIVAGKESFDRLWKKEAA
jgi:hypothetical protein